MAPGTRARVRSGMYKGRVVRIYQDAIEDGYIIVDIESKPIRIMIPKKNLCVLE